MQSGRNRFYYFGQKIENKSKIKLKQRYSIIHINYNYRRSFSSKIDLKMNKNKKKTKKILAGPNFSPKMSPDQLSPDQFGSKIGRRTFYTGGGCIIVYCILLQSESWQKHCRCHFLRILYTLHTILYTLQYKLQQTCKVYTTLL